MSTVDAGDVFEDLLHSDEEILGAEEGLQQETGKSPETCLVLTVGNKRQAFVITIGLSLLEPIVKHLKEEQKFQGCLPREGCTTPVLLSYRPQPKK